MSFPSVKCRRICLALLCGAFLSWAHVGRTISVRAQSSQTAPADAPPQPQSTAAGPAAQAQPPAPSDAPEMNSQDAPVPLRVRIDLIPVRVVVRDSQGRAVTNLHKEDFQLFEDGKPQDIANFAVETPA